MYWSGLEAKLFNDDTYSLYMREISQYLKEKVLHTIDRIRNRIGHIEEEVNDMLPSLDIDELRELAKRTLIAMRSSEMVKQQERIVQFRLKWFDAE